MKYRIILTLIVLLLSTPLAFATPNTITLYPHGAKISEQTKIAAKTDVVTLQLPNAAIPQSLKLKLEKAAKQKIGAIEFESILPDSSRFQKLKDRITKLEDDIAAVDDQLQADQLALVYWKKQQEFPIKTLADARAMGKIIQEESIALLKNSTRLKKKKTTLERQLKEARHELQQKTGNNQRNWRITVKLTRATQKPLLLTYSYRVRHAGWASNYTLNALPGQKQVEWIWTAKIMQQTGVDWKNVHLKIATTEPVFTLTPPQMRPWDIDEKQFTGMARGREMLMAMPQKKMMLNAAEPVVADDEMIPVREEGQLFDIYDLGRVDIASGKESRIKIREGSWNADFTYLSRPLLSEQVFLEAKLKFAENFTPLPTGKASIQVDGVHVGQRNFSLHEKQNVKISFGSDPGLVVDVKTNHVAGEKGLLSKKRTYKWNWAISFANNKGQAIDLRVEDVLPHVGHKKIVLEESFSSPQPQKDKDKLIWALTLPPQGKQQIKYGYSVQYPEDLDVSLGR